MKLLFRSPLLKAAAEKLRDSLAKGLYEKLFREILQKINDHLAPCSSNNSIGILDIAGFGVYKILSSLTIIYYNIIQTQ